VAPIRNNSADTGPDQYPVAIRLLRTRNIDFRAAAKRRKGYLEVELPIFLR
jgi:hypothetical protein